MTRREVGKIVLGGLTAASYSRVMGANDRAGVALIGGGRRGREVMGAMLSSGRAELRGICDVYDVQRQRAKTALVKTGDAPFECVAHEDLLARRDVDAVLIGAPDHLHLDLATAALQAGKHVYLEKPTTHRFEEATKLREAVRASGKVLQCGTQQRSGPHYIRAKEEIFAKKRLGRVVMVRTTWSDFPWQTRHIEAQPRPAGLDWERFLGHAPKHAYDWIRYDSWRYFPDYGNGLLADILTHWADVAQWMMDEEHPLTAETTGGIYVMHDGRENPDTVNAILQYAGGWNLSFESSVLPLKEPRPTVVFLGTEGCLDISRTRYVFTPNSGKPETAEAGSLLEPLHTANFLDAIQKGTKPSAPVEAGIQACNPVHLARLAYLRQARVKWEELAG
jgi:predicted dehydrogenase